MKFEFREHMRIDSYALNQIVRYGLTRGYNIDWELWNRSELLGEVVTTRPDQFTGRSLGTVVDVNDDRLRIVWFRMSNEVPRGR